MTAILTVQGLEKRFGTRRVLDGASFAVHERDRIGMIGANGAGKSTLLEIVVHRAMGGDDPTLAPDAGLVTWKRDLALEYVAQEPVLDPELLVGAAVARAGVADHEVATLAAALELPPLDQRIATLSLGERRRVALARALLGKADVLALDEPTNHLDATTVEWLETRLAGWPGALIVVTHDRYFLDRVATRILEVDRGRVYSYDGDYEDFLFQQADRLVNVTCLYSFSRLLEEACRLGARRYHNRTEGRRRRSGASRGRFEIDIHLQVLVHRLRERLVVVAAGCR